MSFWNSANVAFSIAWKLCSIMSRTEYIHTVRFVGLWVDLLKDNNPAHNDVHMDVDSKNDAIMVAFNDLFHGSFNDWRNKKQESRSFAELLCGKSFDHIGIDPNIGTLYIIHKSEPIPEFGYHSEDYEYIDANTGKTHHLDTDFPLLHHAPTEFLLDWAYSCEQGDFSPKNEFKRAGVPLFNLNVWNQKRNRCKLTIRKTGPSAYQIDIESNNLSGKEDYILTNLWNFAYMNPPMMDRGLKQSYPTIVIYFSADNITPDEWRIERIINNGFSNHDFISMLPTLTSELGRSDKARDYYYWANYIPYFDNVLHLNYRK